MCWVAVCRPKSPSSYWGSWCHCDQRAGHLHGEHDPYQRGCVSPLAGWWFGERRGGPEGVLAGESWSSPVPQQQCSRATPGTTTVISMCLSTCSTHHQNYGTSSSSRSRPLDRHCSSRGTLPLTGPSCWRRWERICPRAPRKTWTTQAPKLASASRATGDSLTTLSESSRW